MKQNAAVLLVPGVRVPFRHSPNDFQTSHRVFGSQTALIGIGLIVSLSAWLIRSVAGKRRLAVPTWHDVHFLNMCPVCRHLLNTRLTSAQTSMGDDSPERAGSLSEYPLSGVETAAARQQHWGWTFFLFASCISVLASVVNVSLLSAAHAYHTFSSPVKTPSVYMGLESLQRDPARGCRSRTTFPQSFATFHDDDVQQMTPVHAPDDKTSIAFGGKISAHATFYVPDYGLENCTMSVKNVERPPSPPDAVQDGDVEIWMLPEKGRLADKVYIDTLRFSPGVESTSRPFFCRSRSRMFFQWVCPQKVCHIHYSIEGVTTMSWISMSQ
ncbi:predicted protein [Postia placenta Mad-698-R]|uniref:Ubiquitin 3 binding protein But2 C-terminal domain-containing protein n=1 Tax=Postia placenta MAD-698-R-SB12 TaxID=670580 RepID=A0A1X6N0A6_9APHY|nr:hypothetical protein POSPLADRAFT_1046520 [Postia placenta MAD-698-R-SB12]EED80953.1 predicted protein [Postia placenta Mad-698-R]OSX62059.1 hypothetical protein POSPLADRAFT_1046520 [Postia placenta MAD-698-R-SB12]